MRVRSDATPIDADRSSIVQTYLIMEDDHVK